MRNAKPTGDYLKKKTLKGLDLLPPPKGSWTLILGQALKRCLFVCLQWAGVILISYGCTSSTSLKSVKGANLCSLDESPGCIAPASIGWEAAAHAGGPEADTMSCSLGPDMLPCYCGAFPIVAHVYGHLCLPSHWKELWQKHCRHGRSTCRPHASLG